MAGRWTHGRATGFARDSKRYLGMESSPAMARMGGGAFTAHDVASLFLREVVQALEARFDDEVTDIAIATPSGFYETYRAELQTILRGVRRRGPAHPLAEIHAVEALPRLRAFLNNFGGRNPTGQVVVGARRSALARCFRRRATGTEWTCRPPRRPSPE